jgi:N-glycosylase/DNA lyase
VVFLKQSGDLLEYASAPYDAKLTDFIHDYFNLRVNVRDLYAEWSLKDATFAKHSLQFAGIRVLRQDPWENLISFICSSNNNIKRISSMCENLCINFGNFVTTTHDGIDHYSFPTVETLAQEGVEERLRELSFGYRAKYIHKTANQVLASKIDLNGLRELPYEVCHNELIKFTGVGPKVADCVCLMSLDKHDSIPVDTHVYQIAKRDYKLKSKGETVNAQTYGLVRKFFVDMWGPYAGWAQSVLFTADLKDFSVVGTKKGKSPGAAVSVSVSVSVSDSVSQATKEVIKTEDVVKTEIKIEIEQEIEYSITGRPKRRKTIKTEA